MPVVPGKKLTGMKTEMRTSEVAMTALVTSAMAMLVASCGSAGDRFHASTAAGGFGMFENVRSVGVWFGQL